MRPKPSNPQGTLMNMPVLMDLRTAAEHAGLSYWTLRDLVLSGNIPQVRLPGRAGRLLRRIWIRWTDLETFLERQRDARVSSFDDSRMTDWPTSRRKQARKKLESDVQSGVPGGLARFWQPVQATSGSLA